MYSKDRRFRFKPSQLFFFNITPFLSPHLMERESPLLD